MCVMQAELAEQHAVSRAELAGSVNKMHEDWMVVDSDQLIDLTEDMDDAPMASSAEGRSNMDLHFAYMQKH